MQRVVILGREGAGKSSFARKLGHATGLPVIELDQHFWLPLQREGWREIEQELADAERSIMMATSASTMSSASGYKLLILCSSWISPFSVVWCAPCAARRTEWTCGGGSRRGAGSNAQRSREPSLNMPAARCADIWQAGRGGAVFVILPIR